MHHQLFRASSGMDSILSLVHQQLFCTSSRMGIPLLVSSINSCIVHHLAWILYSVLTVNSCFIHHLIWVVLRWSYPSVIVSFIILHGFLHLSRTSTFLLYTSGMDSMISFAGQLFFCTSSGTGIPSLASSINNCFLHHLVWIPSSVSFINGCSVHHLA